MTAAEARRLKAVRTLADAHAMADRFLSEAKAARSRRRSRAPRAVGETREQRRDEKKAETARLRDQVIALADELCERCGYRALAGEGHMHHTLGGSGRRLAEQSIATVAWVCPRCHGTLHRQPALALDFRKQIAAKRRAATSW